MVKRPGVTLKQKMVLDPGDNSVELVVYNGANLVASRPAQAKITWDGAEPTIRPRLYVLVAGINRHVDGKLDLDYAVPDAKAIAAAFREAGRGHYEDVDVTLALDADVTVAKLDRTFSMLAGKIRPRDVFVFFAAAHGQTCDGRYYMAPQDLIYQNEQSLVRSAIGQDQLQKWFSSIAARKAVLMFDTFEAGTLTTAQRVAARGLEQKAALGRLIRATGRTTLTATTATQGAWEGPGGHGIFAYAVLDALARGDLNGNGLIELTELIQHIDSLVPAIAEKLNGSKQIPQMGAHDFTNFSLVRQVAALAPAHGDAVIIPIKPTHVTTELLPVFKEVSGNGGVVQQLPAFAAVTLLKSEEGWVLIARDGKLLGYVAEAKLHKIQ